VGLRELDVVGFLEVTWSAVASTPEVWLDAVVRALRPALDEGLGVRGYFVDMSAPGSFETSGHRVIGGADQSAAASSEPWGRATSIGDRRRAHTQSPLATADGDGADALGVHGLDATGRGCAVIAPRRAPVPPPARDIAELWARLAVHLASAARLQRRCGGDPARAVASGEALLESTGRCVSARGEATDRNAREALREAAVRLERARGRRRGASAKESLSLWQVLVGGRWSLVDKTESDGRRFLVAVPNRPELAGREHLTPTEARILGAMGVGHPNKVIAYELGMAPSTVATHIARAAAKLGAHGRSALVQRLFDDPSLVRLA